MILRRSLGLRIFSALLAGWFVLLVTEPVPAMHRCPMHDGFVQTAGRHAAGHGSHHQAPSHPGLNAFVAGQNLANRILSQSVQVDNVARRYYEPADGRGFYAGLRWSR